MTGRIGSNIHSDPEHFIKEATLVKKAGGSVVQIMLHIPSNKKDYLTYKTQLVKFGQFIKNNNMILTIHSQYVHNLAHDWQPYSWWLISFEEEIKLAYAAGAVGIVLHFGKHLQYDMTTATNNMYTSLIYIYNKTKKYSSVKILLETSTGQGTEMFYNLDDLQKFYNKFKINKDINNRIRLCFDTCHVHQAGYDIESVTKAKKFLKYFDDLIGWEYVYLIHLNDSKNKVGKKLDRHESIGKGYIGKKPLVYLAKQFLKMGKLIVLETPGDSFKNELKLFI